MKQLFRIHPPVILAVLFLTCNNNPLAEKNPLVNNCDQLEAGQNGFIQLVTNKEPGELLVIYGKIIDGKTNQPVTNAALFLYQTDSTGIYNANGIDEQARIRGTLDIPASGCFKIRTILPGDYPSQKNSRHLHYILNAKGYKEIKSILFFKGFTTENITSQGPLIVLDIKKDNTGSWIGTTNFYMEAAE